jgi:uncharacterized protein (DUF2132 family)
MVITYCYFFYRTGGQWIFLYDGWWSLWEDTIASECMSDYKIICCFESSTSISENVKFLCSVQWADEGKIVFTRFLFQRLTLNLSRLFIRWFLRVLAETKSQALSTLSGLLLF